MTNTWRARAAPLFLSALVLLVLVSPPVNAQSSSDALGAIRAAFVAVAEAEQSGGAVGVLADQLNEALALVAQGEALEATDSLAAQVLYRQAQELAGQVLAQAPARREAGIMVRQNRLTLLMVELGALAALGVGAYFVVPRLFWRFWLRVHQGWRVRRA